jgi:hypothetical protein
MSEGVQESILKAEGELAVLATEFQIQLLNCSSSGCLMETNARIQVGTIGRLRLQVDGMAFTEEVQIVRCQQIEGAGSIYHVGAQFLWTTAPASGSLRRAMWPSVAPRADGRPSAEPLM